MPTSLLLLSIQVSAASNLAVELPVTFCGRGGRLALVWAEQLGSITLLLGYGSPLLGPLHVSQPCSAQRAANWQEGSLRLVRAEAGDITGGGNVEAHAGKQCGAEAAERTEASQVAAPLGKMKKCGGEGPSNVAWGKPCPSPGLSFFPCEVKTGLGDHVPASSICPQFHHPEAMKVKWTPDNPHSTQWGRRAGDTCILKAAEKGRRGSCCGLHAGQQGATHTQRACSGSQLTLGPVTPQCCLNLR